MLNAFFYNLVPTYFDEIREQKQINARYRRKHILEATLKLHQNRSISHRFRDKCVFAFYAEIQDGRQKWRKNDFWEKLPVDSAYTVRVKNFVKINLSHTVFKIMRFCILPKNSRWPPKNGVKVIFAKCRQYNLQIPYGSKIL